MCNIREKAYALTEIDTVCAVNTVKKTASVAINQKNGQIEYKDGTSQVLKTPRDTIINNSKPAQQQSLVRNSNLSDEITQGESENPDKKYKEENPVIKYRIEL